jgi:hypothetical protein
MAPVAIGLAIGIGAAAALSRYLASQLFGVGTFDPITMVAVVAALAMTAWLACWSPAVRASRLDALAALRME